MSELTTDMMFLSLLIMLAGFTIGRRLLLARVTK